MDYYQHIVDNCNKKYNILLLMTDQHRFDVLGCMGNKYVQTPNLDRLAEEGTIFRSAYTECPCCIPARASLLTGMDQWHTGLLGMGSGQGPMGTSFKHTLPGELAEAGYYCKGVGKMHFFPQRSLNGFHHIQLDESKRHKDPNFISDYERFFNDHKDGDYPMSKDRHWNGWEGKAYGDPPFLHPNFWTANESINFINDRDPSMPFFLKTSFARPHSPYDAIEEYFAKYQNMDLPKAVVGDWAFIHDDKETAKLRDAWRGVKTDDQIHAARAGYYGNVEHIDHEIGNLLDFMKERGVLDNTLIMFTSDHGDMLGDHNLWRKTYAYEGSAHIPLIVRLPKDMQNSAVNEVNNPVMLRDIMPSMLDFLGLDIPAGTDGQSFMPLIKGQQCQWRDYAHGEDCTCYSPEMQMHYLTDGKIKYIWYARTGSEQLFDLANDPYERHDLCQNPVYQDILKQLRSHLSGILETRNCGLVDDGKLVCQAGREPIFSPYYYERTGIKQPDIDSDINLI